MDPDIETIYQEIVERGERDMPHAPSAEQRRFSRQRFREGEKVRRHLEQHYPQSLLPGARVLDIGCGSGGFLLPFAAEGRYRCIGMELEPRPESGEILRRTGVTLTFMGGDAARLPFRDGSLHLIMLAETIEHVADAAALGREAARALAPGGLCYITSPPRLRHLFGRDPHYGIRGLLAFPDLLQPWIFRRLRQGRPYEVRHTFWTQWGITRHFPGLRVAEVVSRNWAGFPRRLDWDWIILRKPSPP